MPRFETAQVRRYYDRHTSGFVALGQGGEVGAIHRAVWGPGARTRRDAFRYVELQIAARLRDLADGDSRVPFVVDLGCGIGSTLCGLAEHVAIRGVGVTLSPVQARMADELIRQAGLSEQIRCVEADFGNLPADLETTDLAFAIESFVHSPDPQRFFDECARIVRPGGLLLICDDVERPTDDPAAKRAIERFRRGWHVNTLLPSEELRHLALGAGFEHDTTHDLTPYLENGRPRDRAIGVFVALIGWLPPVARRFDHLVGGSALQTCLTKGWIGYELAVFRRVG